MSNKSEMAENPLSEGKTKQEPVLMDKPRVIAVLIVNCKHAIR